MFKKVFAFTLLTLAVLAFTALRLTGTAFASSDDLDQAGAVSPSAEDFKFSGALQDLTADSFTVNGVLFRYDGVTRLETALTAGQPVLVEAIALPDGTYLALEVKQPLASTEVGFSTDDSGEFKIYGTLESMGAQWIVAGRVIEVTSATLLDSGLSVGGFVKVEGRIVDGKLVAKEIETDSGDDLSGSDDSSGSNSGSDDGPSHSATEDSTGSSSGKGGGAKVDDNSGKGSDD